MGISIKGNSNCGCAHCKNNLGFNLPSEIIQAAISENLVVFAGAGISTEKNKLFRETLYEDVLTDLKKPPKETLDFPSLMSLYCGTNINGRQKLLQKIKFRFDYCKQFSELYRQASWFHHELSSIYYIKTIITTNWDDYFEQECGAIPITIPEDFAFYNLPDRKVIKIHGSISNYGTIVATKQDYANCYRRLNRGIIGSQLKNILATKVILFVGYSFRDYDFLKIYSYLKKELKELIPHIYIVTIDKSLKKENSTIINTDGKFFISALRKHLEGSNYLIEQNNIDNINELKSILSFIHVEISSLFIKSKQVNLIYCSFYQDGIKHALDYLLFNSRSGLTFYPPKLFSSIDAYEQLKKEKLKAKNYADVAYIEGYIEGLKTIIYKKSFIKQFPFWFIFGVGKIYTKGHFTKAIKGKQVLHKSAEIFGRKYFKNALSKESELVLHHTPFL